MSVKIDREEHNALLQAEMVIKDLINPSKPFEKEKR